MLVKRLTALACVLLAVAHASHAQEYPAAGLQPLSSVRTAAENAVRTSLDKGVSGVEVEAIELDARLRLPACGGSLATFVPPPRANQTRMLVRVACTRNTVWSLNVPVEVRRAQQVLVLKRAVGRGEALSALDVIVETRMLPGLASPYVGRIEDLKGRVTRRPIPAGSAVTADALGPVLLIKRGQRVMLAAATGGIEVRAPGLALADASATQHVRVQNLNSLKIVEGVAETPGVVRVNF
jgi:flagella basal body P-ring formation protein FlgA